MSSDEQQRLEEEQLQEEIEELRGDLGETVEALVHKADLPARAKERGTELTERALDRGVEWHQEAMKRGNDLGAQVKEWFGAVKEQATGRTSEWRDQAGKWRDQATSVTERAARRAIDQTPPLRGWLMLGVGGFVLVLITVIVRRIRS